MNFKSLLYGDYFYIDNNIKWQKIEVIIILGKEYNARGFFPDGSEHYRQVDDWAEVHRKLKDVYK